jgi:WD40 repeat protein
VPEIEITSPAASPEVEAPATRPTIQVRPLRVLKGYEFVIDSLAFSPDGSKLVSGGGKNEPFLKVWSVATGEELQKLRAQQTAIKAIAISPNSRILATAGQDADVNIWDLQSPDSRIRRYLEQDLTVMALAITPDSKFLISGALDGIWLWTLNPNRPFYQLLGYGTPVYALAIAPNGYTIATGHSDGRVRFWNLRRGSISGEFRPHTDGITGVAFTPDGKKLVTSSQDRTIKIWNLETGALLHELKGHTQGIRSIALSPNGEVVASASNDGVRLWSISTGRLVAKPYQDDPDWVQSLAFSPDGRILAAGKFNGTIALWQVD